MWNRFSVPAKEYSIIFTKIEKKDNTMNPPTENIELNLKKKTDQKRINFKVCFDIVNKKKEFRVREI